MDSLNNELKQSTMQLILKRVLLISLLLISLSCKEEKVSPEKIDNLICFWDFSEEAGQKRKTKAGKCNYILCEGARTIPKAQDGVFGNHSAVIMEGDWFCIPRNECPELNIHGEKAQETVVAWVKRAKKMYNQCEAIAGIWDETNKHRQYCLFLDLRIWESSQQVGGHVSGVGGPTDGYKYCMDASIGATKVPLDIWQCIGFTYDGEKICSYLNGVLDARNNQNPYSYPLGLHDGGIKGGDFTVGAVNRSGEMGNFFVGQIGGLAVYDRALTKEEMAYLASNITDEQ